jgi:Protein of unknown function (DUF4230)
MKSGKNLIYAIALLFAIAFSVYITRWWYRSNDPKTITESQVLLESVKNVSKLVTVEGYFSEIYSEEDTKDYYLFSSTKKALLKVKAKVSAGYDLNNMKIDADPQNKTLKISNIPEATIISIEPEISYYDIESGYFNPFTKDDISRLNKKAVDTIRTQALQSPFMQSVKTQGVKNFDALRLLAESMGWKLVFDNVATEFKQ